MASYKPPHTLLGKETRDFFFPLKKSPSLKLNEEYLVQVSSFNNPGRFHVIFPQGVTPVHELSDSNVDDSFDIVFVDMQQYYFSKTFDSNKYSMKTELQFVACLSQEHGKWYRGVYLGPDGVNYAKIFYPDFGDTEVVPLNNLRNLSVRFLKVPLQAVRCSLSNVEPVGGKSQQWSKDACRVFLKHCIEKDVVIKVKRIEAETVYVEMRLLLPDENEIVSINDILIQTQCARPSRETVHLHPG